MYVARFDSDGGELVQCLAVLRWATRATALASDAWWAQTARQLVAALRIDGATVGRRIQIDAERRLTQLVVVTAPATEEQAVRLVFAGLATLERLLGSSIEIATTREFHDTHAVDFPSLRYSIGDDSFFVRGIPIVCNLRLANVLDDLLSAALVSGERIGYQLLMKTQRPDRMAIREARRVAAQLNQVPGVSHLLVTAQEALSARLGTACGLAEEYLAVESEAGAAAAAAAIQERVKVHFSSGGIAGLMPRFVRGAHEEQVTSGIMRDALPTDSTAALGTRAISLDERETLVNWKPSAHIMTLIAPFIGHDDGERSPVKSVPTILGSLPQPYSGNGRFGFVSYRRHDVEKMAAIVQTIQDTGTSFWYDRGIRGGAEWDAVVEERLASCSFVLLVVSAKATESKYLRREVKYADALNIPVIAILVEDSVLGHGMDMLLRQHQMLDARSADFRERLTEALAGVL